MARKQINNLAGIPQDVSYEDLRFGYYTGQAVLLSGSGRDKKYTYRHGVSTKLGDIEESVWCEAMVRLIEHSGELGLLQSMTAWVTDNSPLLRTDSERHKEAVVLMSYRMFDDPKWVGYEEFNRKYRPDNLPKDVDTNETRSSGL